MLPTERVDTAMLKQRVITALVLAAIFGSALFAPSPTPFIALVALLMGVAGWEWARLAGIHGVGAWASGVLCVALCLVLERTGAVHRPLAGFWEAMGVVWVLAGVTLLARGTAAWGRLPCVLRWLVGLVVLCVAWLALARARTMGINFLLSVLCLVWVADISAYFSGRAWGGRWIRGRKLAPSISPGKTWEGVAGAVMGTWILAAVWIALDRSYFPQASSLYTHLLDRGLVFLILGVLFLVGMSVVGDLSESLVKRAAGVKDSSRLLPGHGGVLDRIDALLPTLPLALALMALGAGG